MEQRNVRYDKFKLLKYLLVVLAVFILILLSLPIIFSLIVQRQQNEPVVSNTTQQFPVTVNPKNKTIVENAEVNAYLEGSSSPFVASVAEADNPFWDIFTSVATAIADMPWYQNIASVSGIDSRLITVNPGMRKEQVAEIFAKALSWNNQQKEQFVTPGNGSTLPLVEGSFFPGTYFVDGQMTPTTVQALVNDRFTENVLDHYGTSTAQIVPLSQALTIASIIQRETIGNADMRLVSGIIWNRIFMNMNLQIDATLQYAKASSNATAVWWPNVIPKDKYIKSPYNTYINPGLPPTPIASPSVAAILAALNPIKTSCVYYFNDKKGGFHCSPTYAEHVKLLKEYYGN